MVASHERWEVEVTIDEIDTHQRLAQHPLRSQKPIGVLQELYGLLIAHYAVRSVMQEAARQAGIDPDRSSFVRAVSLIKDAIPDFQVVSPQLYPRVYGQLSQDLLQNLLPPRAKRTNPRVVKRKMSNFKCKRASQRGRSPLQCAFADTVQILTPALPLHPNDLPTLTPDRQLLPASLI